jgi:hypothetical protein
MSETSPACSSTCVGGCVLVVTVTPPPAPRPRPPQAHQASRRGAGDRDDFRARSHHRRAPAVAELHARAREQCPDTAAGGQEGGDWRERAIRSSARGSTGLGHHHPLGAVAWLSPPGARLCSTEAVFEPVAGRVAAAVPGRPACAPCCWAPSPWRAGADCWGRCPGLPTSCGRPLGSVRSPSAPADWAIPRRRAGSPGRSASGRRINGIADGTILPRARGVGIAGYRYTHRPRARGIARHHGIGVASASLRERRAPRASIAAIAFSPPQARSPGRSRRAENGVRSVHVATSRAIDRLGA